MVITIDGTVVSAESEILEEFNKNDELSSLVLEIKHISKDESYDMDLHVTVVDDGITDYYITGHDAFVRVAFSPDLYNHRITLFEAAKDLERITLPSLKFTQELDTTTYTKLDVIDRALKVWQLDKYSNLGGNRVYDISGIGTRDSNDCYVVANLSGLAKKLHDEKAPEFSFTTPILKEICDEVFLTLDGHCVLSDFTTIDIEYYNDDETEISLSDVDEITGSQSIEKNAQKFDIYMENAISENNLNKQAITYPSSDAWTSVRSSETELTTKNFIMDAPEDIERVLKWEIYVDVTIEYNEYDGSTTNAKVFNNTMKVDVTDFLYYKRAWDSLDYEFNTDDLDGSTDTWFNSGKYHNNTLYIDGNQIKGWHEDNTIFSYTGDTDNWHTFLATVAYENGDLVVSSGFWVKNINLLAIGKPKFNGGVEEFMYRLTYVPLTNARLILEKDDNVSSGTLYASQSDRIVDSELLGQKLKSKLDRDGAKELRFTKQCAYSDRFTLTNYYGDYKAVTVYNNRQDQFTLSTVVLSKGFVKRSERLTIANKPRMTAISRDTVVRNDLINEYMILSTSVSAANNTYMEQDGIARFLDTFNNGTLSSDNPVELVTWNGVSILMLPCISQGIENVLHFKFGFDNPIVAGTQIEALGGTEANNHFRYSNEDGTLERFSFKLYGGFTAVPDTFAQNVIVAQDLPHYDLANIALTEKYFDIETISIFKDSGETYQMTYQLTIVSDTTDILVGKKLATENALVIKDTEDVYLYTQSSKFKSKLKIPSTAYQYSLVTGTPSDQSEVKIVFTDTAIYGAIELTTNFPSGSPYWAIGNSDRDLYFAVNMQDEQVIYFNPKHKRSDL